MVNGIIFLSHVLPAVYQTGNVRLLAAHGLRLLHDPLQNCFIIQNQDTVWCYEEKLLTESPAGWVCSGFEKKRYKRKE